MQRNRARPKGRWAGIAGALATSLLLCSCASRRPAAFPASGTVETAVPAGERSSLAELYAGIEGATAEYLEGLEFIVAGDEVRGEERMAAASNQLRDDAEACARRRGCDMGHFFDAFERLLTEQDVALKLQAGKLATLEASFEEEVREPGTSPFVAAVPELTRTESLLRGTNLRELITLNGPVNAAIDDWLTWMRPALIEAYENYQYLRSRIAPVYEEAGLPEALLFAMLATESGGKVHAYSRAGAAGPLQFMRRTGARYGLTVVDGFDMRLDPVAATRANVAYLNDQLAALNNNLEKALAAYNGGETRVQRLHRKLAGASFWDSQVYHALPTETQEYVPRILAAALLFLHPWDYNLEFPEPETETTQLALQQEISLGELTVCLGQEGNPDGWFRTLRNLNPRLDPGNRLPAGQSIEVPAILVPVYEERCLSGDLIARARILHDANYPVMPQLVAYQVRKEDTLGRIAARTSCVSLGELAAINGIRPPEYVIRVGQELKVPACR